MSVNHLKGLDGIRGIALIMVLLIHGNAWFMQGGFFAVDVFFVLSGFLITYLLLREYLRDGSISLRNFWARRALRLFPALAAVVLFVLVFARLRFNAAGFGTAVTDVIDTVTYRINWRMAEGGQPPLGMLAHGWSLAVEMQFYIVWPLILIAVLAIARRWGGARGREHAVQVLTITAFVMSALAMVLRAGEAVAGYDWWRTYYGTDVRLDALLMGCALAGMFSLGWAQRWPRQVGLIGAAVIVLLVAVGDLGDHWVPLWGSAVVTLAAALLIIDVVNHGPTTPVLSWRLFVFLGTVSYGAYLWHWPIYMAVNASWLPISPALLLALRIAITLAIATVSYRYLELPALRLKSRFTRASLPTQASEVADITTGPTAGAGGPGSAESAAPLLPPVGRDG